MATTVSHLKKNESLSNKQLIVVNSNDRDDVNQTTSSFTYTFEEAPERISRVDVMFADVPNTFYNVNNDNASMGITTTTFTDTIQETLVVDDIEIQNGIIDATNVQDSSFNKYNLYNASIGEVNNIVTKDTFLYSVGTFSGSSMDFYNFTGASANNLLTNEGIKDIFVAKYSLEQELVFRFRISGSLTTILPEITISDSSIYVSGIFDSFPLKFYNHDDTTITNNDVLSDGNNCGFIAKYTTDGVVDWSVRIVGIRQSTNPIYVKVDSTNGFLYATGTYTSNLQFYNTQNVLQETLAIQDTPNAFIAQYDLDGNINWVRSLNYSTTTDNLINTVNDNLVVATDFTSNPFYNFEWGGNLIAMTGDGVIQFYYTTKYVTFSATYINNKVYISVDGGITWSICTLPSSNIIRDVAMSSDGTIITTVYPNIYTTTDFGTTWVEFGTGDTFESVAMSLDGSIQIAVTSTTGRIWRSINSGVTWIQIYGGGVDYNKIAMSENGEIVTVVGPTIIFISTNYGVNWTEVPSIVGSWNSVSMSSDGVIQTAVGDRILVSIDKGSTWEEKLSISGFESNDMSSDGSIQTAVVNNGKIYVSSDTGNSWYPKTSDRNWKSITMNSDGSYQKACEQEPIINTTDIYESSNMGDTWNSAYLNFDPDGLVNIMVSELNSDGVLVNKFKIGGSDTDTNGKLVMKESNLFVSGSFTSNPVKFRNSDDTFTITEANTSLSDNTFVVLYKESIAQWSAKIESSNSVSNVDISLGSNSSVFVLATYNDLAKFYDVDGYQIGKDLINTSGVNYSLMAKYDISGKFINRNNITSANAVVPTSIEASSTKLYISTYFTADIELNNTDGTSTTVVNSGSTNSVVVSYINSSNNYDIDRNTLNKTIIFKDLTGTDINYILNLNAFSQSLGFTTSQKFRASVFGSTISWTELQLTEGINDTISITFRIADLTTDTFVDSTCSFKLDIYTTYTPYSLAYQLNTVIKNKLLNGNIFNYIQTFEPVIYDSTANIFYIQFDINGTFKINETTLSNSSNLNLPITISPHVVISDKTIASSGDITINNNTKLSIKVSDNIITDKVNNVSFTEAFPSINSNVLTISAVGAEPITAQSGSIEAIISNDIQLNDEITFDSPWITRKTNENIISSADWNDVAMSSDGSIRLFSVDSGHLYIYRDKYESHFTERDIERKWNQVAMSIDGTIMVATTGDSFSTSGLIFISLDVGTTWIQSSAPNLVWTGIDISDNGLIMVVTERNGSMYISNNTGSTWSSIADGTGNEWKSISISGDGSKIVAVANNALIYYSDDTAVTWFTKDISRNWSSVAISNNGLVIAATDFTGYIYISNDISFDTWSPVETPRPWSTIAISSDGSFITAGADGDKIYVSSDMGSNWTPKETNRSWYAVAMSHDGLFQSIVAANDRVFSSINSGESWSAVVPRSWVDVEISSDTGDTIIGIVSIYGFPNIVGYKKYNLFISEDRGKTWRKTQYEARWNSVAISSDGTILAAVSENNQIIISDDTGYNWRSVDSIRNWISIDISSDGSTMIAASTNGYIYVSIDTGNTWLSKEEIRNWTDVSISSDGIKMAAVASLDKIYYSTDSGNTWESTATGSGTDFKSVSISGDGSQIAAVGGSTVLISVGTFFTGWVDKTPDNSLVYESVSSSDDGEVITTVAFDGNIFTTEDRGVTWGTRDYKRAWRATAITGDGSIQLACGQYYCDLYISADTGVTWNPNYYDRIWSSCSTSASGILQTTVAFNDYIYVSKDVGNTWTTRAGINTWSSIDMSYDGVIQVACSDDGGSFPFLGEIWISHNTGDTWTITSAPTIRWTKVIISADGSIITAISQNSNEIWISYNTGDTWAITSAPALQWDYITMTPSGIIQAAIGSSGVGIWLTTDTGETWNQIVTAPLQWSIIEISSDGDIIVGFDLDDYIQISYDRGVNWVQTTAPQKPNEWKGLAISSNANVILAFTSNEIWVSIDFGVTWTTEKTRKSIMSCDMSSNGGVQMVCESSFSQYTGDIYGSVDTGITWNQKYLFSEPIIKHSWLDIEMSADGQYQTATTGFGPIYISNDKGITWNTRFKNRQYSNISISADGQIQVVVVSGEDIYTSSDFGESWTGMGADPKTWTGTAISADGSKIIVVVGNEFPDSGEIWESANLGAFTEVLTSPTTFNWSDCAISSDGDTMVVVASDEIWVSVNSGVNWNKGVSGIGVFIKVDISANGINQVVCAFGGGIYTSTDAGGNWSITSAPFLNWSDVAMSSDDGTKIAAIYDSFFGRIYTTIDFGITWAPKGNEILWNGIAISSDGKLQAASTFDDQIHTHSFELDRDIVFNVQTIESGLTDFDKLTYNETVVEDATLSTLHNFNMADAINYSIKTITELGVEDIFVPPGNYTPETLVAEINSQITVLNPSFTDAFTYDPISGRMSFTSIYSGTNVIASTELLTQMGFSTIPSTITATIPITGSNIVNTNLSGPNNIFIKSSVIGDLRKQNTAFSRNPLLKNVISPLILDSETNNYKVLLPTEMYLSKKETVEFIDVQIVDENGDIINLNGSKIQLAFYFYSS